jgi:dihydrofolate reductase
LILNQIVAVSSNFAIGKDNELLWHYPEDLKYFKATTLNKIIIMGRKTFDSILKPRNKPLPQRFHIVISRTPQMSSFENVIFVTTIAEAYAMAALQIKLKKYEEDVFILGGAEIYKQTLSDVKNIYITRVNKSYDGDAFYPSDFSNQFTRTNQTAGTESADLTFEIWSKI